jgi:hypothetical protein
MTKAKGFASGMSGMSGMAGVGGVQTLIDDTFAGGVDSDITGRAPDTVNVPGGAWAVYIGADRVDIDGAGHATNTWLGVRAYYDVGAADVEATALSNLANASSRSAINLRVSDYNNCWEVMIRTTQIDINEVNAGARTQRATTAVALGTGAYHTVVATAAGASIAGTVNGGSAVSYGSATLNQTVTKHGFSNYGWNDLWDRFTVVG